MIADPVAVVLALMAFFLVLGFMLSLSEFVTDILHERQDKKRASGDPHDMPKEA